MRDDSSQRPPFIPVSTAIPALTHLSAKVMFLARTSVISQKSVPPCQKSPLAMLRSIHRMMALFRSRLGRYWMMSMDCFNFKSSKTACCVKSVEN